MKWLSDGDQNTRFNHVTAIQRRRRKSIQIIKYTSGEWIKEAEQIYKTLKEWYQNLYTTDLEMEA